MIRGVDTRTSGTGLLVEHGQDIAPDHRRLRPRSRQPVVVGIAGLATVLPFYIRIALLQSRDRSAAAIEMSGLHMNRMSVFWAFPILEATALAALVWAYISVVLGLAVSDRGHGWLPISHRRMTALHRQISLLVLALILVHALAVAFDALGDNLITAFIPNQVSQRGARWARDLGMAAFYIALLIGPSYYVRRKIGTRIWRKGHRLAIVVYILSVWHALIAGADIAYYGWVRPFIWLAQLPVLASAGQNAFAVRTTKHYDLRQDPLPRFGHTLCARGNRDRRDRGE